MQKSNRKKENLPYKIIRFKTQEEWLEYRKHVITATAISAIMGDSPWETPFDVYIRLVKGIVKEVQENEFIELGHKYEALLREWTKIKHPEYKYTDPPKGNYMLVNKLKPWMCCTPDELAEDLRNGEHGGAEYKYHKVRGLEDYRRWTSGVLPQNYYDQVVYTINVGRFKFYYLIVALEIEKPKSEGSDEWVFDRIEIREFYFRANEITGDLEAVESYADTFWANTQKRIMPGVTL